MSSVRLVLVFSCWTVVELSLCQQKCIQGQNRAEIGTLQNKFYPFANDTETPVACWETSTSLYGPSWRRLCVDASVEELKTRLSPVD